MLRRARESTPDAKGSGWSGPAALKLRRLGPGDDEVLATLARDNASFGTPDERQALEPLRPHDATAFLADDRTIMFVASADSVPVGFVYACELYRRHTELGHLCVYEMGVSDRYRNLGIGKALLDAVADHARGRGISRGFVVTNASDRAAMAVYAEAGGVQGSDDDVVFGFRWGDEPNG